MNTNAILSQGIFTLLGTIIVFLLIFLIIYGITKTFKRFLFELIDHIKGTDRPDYRDEARRACGTSGSKQRKETKPPWEE